MGGPHQAWITQEGTAGEAKPLHEGLNCYLQMDMPALYQREGQAPFEALQRAIDQGPAATLEEAAARNAVSGIVWTPSMRRMYTLLDRWVSWAPLIAACL